MLLVRNVNKAISKIFSPSVKVGRAKMMVCVDDRARATLPGVGPEGRCSDGQKGQKRFPTVGTSEEIY